MTDWLKTESDASGSSGFPAAGVEWVVLVSGWSFGRGMWSDVISTLTQRGVPPDRILCVDWLELGGWLHEVDAPCPVPESALTGQTVWVGWSLGATLVLEAMGRGKVRPMRMLAISATPRHLAEGNEWPGVEMALWRKLRRSVRRSVLPALAEFDAWAGLAGRRGDRLIDPQGLLMGLDWLAAIDQRRLLANPPAPICWLYGTEDPLLPDIRWPSCLAVGVGNQWQVIPGAQHDIPWAHAARVSSEIL